MTAATIDRFLGVARRLGAGPARAVVVEDSGVGVQATGTAAFVLVLGIDRTCASERPRKAGAHAVVRSLVQVALSVAPVPLATDDRGPVGQRGPDRIPARSAAQR